MDSVWPHKSEAEIDIHMFCTCQHREIIRDALMSLISAVEPCGKSSSAEPLETFTATKHSDWQPKRMQARITCQFPTAEKASLEYEENGLQLCADSLQTSSNYCIEILQ